MSDNNILNKTKFRVTFYFKKAFSKYNISELINLLKKNNNYEINEILTFNINDINNESKRILDNTDCLVINSEAIILIPYIFDNYPNFLKSKKIIIIRTLLSYDIAHIHLEPNITNSVLMKNIYGTVNSLLLENNNQIYNYGNAKNLNFYKKIEHYKNLKLMPLWFADFQVTIDKTTFYKIYNLDPTKKIFTIYLSWPKYYKNYKNNKLSSEKYFLQNNDFVIKVKNILNKLNYNVVFKAHPFYGTSFKPTFKIGKNWRHMHVKKSVIPMEQMKAFIPNHTFIEMCHSRIVDFYTDIGMILSASTFALHNYIFNIPLLYLPNDVKLFDSSFLSPLGKKYTHELFYGKIDCYDNFLHNTETILVNFIKKYDNKPKFKYQTNNPLYGNTSIENDTKLFANYIENIINN